MHGGFGDVKSLWGSIDVVFVRNEQAASAGGPNAWLGQVTWPNSL
jgi:hypothetical protein